MAARVTGLLRSASTINLLAGIWMIITPYVFHGGVGADWNGWIFGLLLIICSIARMSMPAQRGFSAANLIWGVWLIISPWACGWHEAGMHWSNDVTGIVVVVCSWLAMTQVPAALSAFDEARTRRAA